MMRWTLLAMLTGASALGAFTLAERIETRSRTERLLAAAVLWNALLTLPALGLGLASLLTRTTLGLSVVAASVACMVAARRGRPVREHASDVRRALIDAARLPSVALSFAWRERSVTLIALPIAYFLIVYTFVVAYFAPSWGGYDSTWYHEPIVGFALQNQGFRPLGIPGWGYGKIDGYPRICEMMHLWFAAFGDRRLIEITNSIIAPCFILAQFALVRSFTASISSAMATSLAVFFMPCLIEELGTTYVDLHSAFFLVAAMYYVTRQELSVATSLLAAIALALGVGSKHMALPPAAPLAVILFVRTVLSARKHGPTAFAIAGLGAVVILGMVASIYVRNYVLFHQPLFPEAVFDVAASGYRPRFTHAQFEQVPIWTQMKDLLDVPFPAAPRTLTMGLEIGVGTAWILLPVGMIGFAWAALRFVGAAFRTSAPGRLCLLLAPLVVSVFAFKVLWIGRYDIPHAAILAAAAAWWSAQFNTVRWSHIAPQLAVFANILMLYWMPHRLDGRWFVMPSELVKLIETPYPQRELLATSAFAEKELDPHRGSAVRVVPGLARHAELTEHSIVFSDGSTDNPLMLWNDSFSNQVHYAPPGPTFVPQALAAGAQWMCISKAQNPQAYDRLKNDAEWQSLGPMNADGAEDVIIFHRLPR